jgi:hypothetical protein
VVEIVHNFLVAVHVVQRGIKNFLVAKEGKVAALEKVWLKLENKYIRKMMKKREAQKKKNTVSDTKLDFDFFDAKTKVEMKSQARKWSQIDAQMEEQIIRLKVKRVIVKESEEEAVNALMVPAALRVARLKSFLSSVVSDVYSPKSYSQ